MPLGILGKKLGMSHVYDSDGSLVPVTVIEAGPCPILQIKTRNTDGYNALQLGFGSAKEKRTTKPMLGHFKLAKVTPAKFIREVKVDDEPGLAAYKVGQVLDVTVFKAGDKVDITGVSKGRGFAGTTKRFGSHGGPDSHGSRYHRRPGSMGASSDPSRVLKGKVNPGHMGNNRCTVLNLKVVKTDKDKNLLIVKGSVPGHNNGFLIVRRSKKEVKRDRKKK